MKRQPKKTMKTKIGNYFRLRSQRRKKLSLRYFWLQLVLFGFLIALGTFILQASGTNSENAWNFAAAWDFFKQNPAIGVYNYLLIFCLGILCVCLLGNFLTGSLLFALISGVAAFANYQKVVARNQAIFPEELSFIRNLKTMLQIIDAKAALFIVVAVIIAIILIGVAQYFFGRYYFFSKHISRSLRSIGAALALVILFLFCNINNQESWASRMLQRSKIEMNPYNQVFNYNLNGIILGFCYNVRGETIEKPADYSKAAIAEVVERYQAQSSTTNQTAQKTPDVSVIYILSESFTDPMRLNDYYELNEDPIPFTRELMQNYASGYALVPEYGGGTANTEYEALTSLSNYFINGIPFQNLVPKEPELPSIAKYFAVYGYETLALHPNDVDMYRRDKTYPNLGITQYYGIDSLNHPDPLYEGGFVSDQAFFTDIYEKLTANTNQKFIHGVTIQNHQPYNADSYPDSQLTINAKSELTESTLQSMESYVAGLQKSDQAMREFIEKIAELDQKVAVVFWGDHYPGDGLYSGLLEEEPLKLRETPFFIYTNFAAAEQDLGVQSLNYLSYDLLHELNFPLTPYYALMGSLLKELPGLTDDSLLGPAEKQLTREDLANIQAFHDYELIQYDLIKGRQYSVDMDFYQVH